MREDRTDRKLYAIGQELGVFEAWFRAHEDAADDDLEYDRRLDHYHELLAKIAGLPASTAAVGR